MFENHFNMEWCTQDVIVKWNQFLEASFAAMTLHKPVLILTCVSQILTSVALLLGGEYDMRCNLESSKIWIAVFITNGLLIIMSVLVVVFSLYASCQAHQIPAAPAPNVKDAHVGSHTATIVMAVVAISVALCSIVGFSLMLNQTCPPEQNQYSYFSAPVINTSQIDAKFTDFIADYLILDAAYVNLYPQITARNGLIRATKFTFLSGTTFMVHMEICKNYKILVSDQPIVYGNVNNVVTVDAIGRCNCTYSFATTEVAVNCQFT